MTWKKNTGLIFDPSHMSYHGARGRGSVTFGSATKTLYAKLYYYRRAVIACLKLFFSDIHFFSGIIVILLPRTLCTQYNDTYFYYQHQS